MVKKNIEYKSLQCYNEFNARKVIAMYNEVLEKLIVVKRSGQRVSFNASKVALAIKKAFDSTDKVDDKKVFTIFEKTLKYINDNYQDRKTINVEDIQDIIENILYNEKCYEVYNSFKEYRQKRALSRKLFAEKQQHKFVKAIERIEETTANKDDLRSADELMFEFGKTITSEYTKAYILDTKSLRALEEGNIYIHDLDYFTLGVFPNIHLKLDNNFESVDALLNEIINVASEVNGEIGISNIDFLLESFIIKKYKERFMKFLKRYLKLLGFIELIDINKLEEKILLENSINLPFDNYSNVFCNEQLKKIFETAKEDTNEYIQTYLEQVITTIITTLENRSPKHTTYVISFGKNYSYIGKLVQEKIFEILSSKTFEKININIKIQNSDMELAHNITKVLGKCKEVGVQFDDNKEIEYFNNGIRIYENANANESVSVGRMIVSSTSINLARLGLKYKNKNIDEFYEELENVAELVKNELLLSFETIGSKAKDYYKTLFLGNVYDDEKLECGQKIRKVIKNGVLNIGLIGLSECANLLAPDENERLKLMENILDFLNELCLKYTKETKLNFAIFEPVDTSARARSLAIDKAIYGTVQDITDKKRYDLLDVNLQDNYKKYQNLLAKFGSGKLIIANISGVINLKKVNEILETIQNNCVSYVKIVGGKSEY